ncbi:hypothetical protein MMC30_004807 [Trapelia coarctata]|nr:hypothetical protein [Trapelia coarctata]
MILRPGARQTTGASNLHTFREEANLVGLEIHIVKSLSTPASQPFIAALGASAIRDLGNGPPDQDDPPRQWISREDPTWQLYIAGRCRLQRARAGEAYIEYLMAGRKFMRERHGWSAGIYNVYDRSVGGWPVRQVHVLRIGMPCAVEYVGVTCQARWVEEAGAVARG